MGLFGGTQKGAHVLAVPFPLHGHIIPMLRFTTELAREGIAVTFVCYEDAIPRLTAAASGADAASSELPAYPDCFRVVTVRKPRPETASTVESAAIFGEACAPFFKKLVDGNSAGSSAGYTCVIGDAFLSFSRDGAENLQIPWYAFIPAGMIYVRFLQGVIEHFESGQFQISKTDGTLIKPERPMCISFSLL